MNDVPTLVVHVVDSYDGSPVPEANVRIKKDGKYVAIGITDRNGIATFHLDPGDYVVEVRDQIHFPRERAISFPEIDTVKIELVKRTWTR